MGDRANVIIKSGDEQVCLYTHWNGYRLQDVVRDALKRATSRWEDTQYLARIIFCEMVKDDLMGLGGFGISQTVHDNERPLITICTDDISITVGGVSFSLSEYCDEYKCEAQSDY
jgi:hypothetical protein